MPGYFLVHFPYLTMSGAATLKVGGCSFEALALDEWLDLDDDWDFLADEYTEARPVFYRIPYLEQYAPEFELSGNRVVLPELLAEQILRLWHSVLLTASAVPSVDPNDSVTYFRYTEGGIQIWPLRFNRWLLTAHGNLGTDLIPASARKNTGDSESSLELDTIIAEVRRNHELLSLVANNTAIDGVAALFDVLALISGPEFQAEETWAPEISVLSAVAAAEGLFPRPPRGTTLTSAFGSRMAFLFSEQPAIDDISQAFSALYTLRSKIIHGESRDRYPAPLRGIAREFLRLLSVRLLLCRANMYPELNRSVCMEIANPDGQARAALGRLWKESLTDDERDRTGRLLSALGSLIRQ
jgi:hypothetical protein